MNQSARPSRRTNFEKPPRPANSRLRPVDVAAVGATRSSRVSETQETPIRLVLFSLESSSRKIIAAAFSVVSRSMSRVA